MKKVLAFLILGAAFVFGQANPIDPNMIIGRGTAAASTRPCSDSVNVGSIWVQQGINPSIVSICQQTGALTLGVGAFSWVPLSSTVTTNCGTAAACAATNITQTSKVVVGTVTFSAATTATITAMPAFTASTSYACTANSNAHTYTVEISYVSTTSFTITAGTSNSDQWTYLCVGS